MGRDSLGMEHLSKKERSVKNRQLVSICCFALLAAGMILSCSRSDSSESQNKAIFGNDDRQAASDADVKKAVGFLSAAGSIAVSCNGFFNSPNTIMTAGHCFQYDDARTSIENLLFITSEATYHVKNVSRAWEKGDVLELRVMETNNSYLKTAALTTGASLEIYSFDPEGKLLTNRGNLITDNADGTLFHDLDTVASSSGSVIIQNNRAVGLHLGTLYTDDTKTVAEFNVATSTLSLGETSATNSYATLKAGSDRLTKECPDGEHNQCVLPRPWPGHGCAQSICVPNAVLSVPTDPRGAEILAALRSGGVSSDFAYDAACATSVGGTVGWGMACVGCIAASTVSAAATAVACATPCGSAAGSIVTALKTCKI